MYKTLTENNKYYVGAPHLVLDNNKHRKSLNDAIQEAKEACCIDGQARFVVKIVAVIERSEPPVKVTRVK